MNFERQIINEGVFNLESGIIADFQIEDYLRNKAVSSFEIDKIATEIRKIYNERRPRY